MKAKLGFTLIEVMVAIFFVSLGAIMYSALMPMAAKGSRMVSNYQQASSLVQKAPGYIRDRSSTLTPASGPELIGEAPARARRRCCGCARGPRRDLTAPFSNIDVAVKIT